MDIVKEKGISLKSAKTVFENIDRNKYNVYKIQIDTDGWFGFDENDNKQLINRTDFSFEINGKKITDRLCFYCNSRNTWRGWKIASLFRHARYSLYNLQSTSSYTYIQ